MCPHFSLHCRGDFGGQATLAQVQAELSGYSDHQLHAFCSASRSKRLQELVLPADKVAACPYATPVYCCDWRRSSCCLCWLSTSSLWALR